MKSYLTNSFKKFIEMEAKKAAPEECCGLISKGSSLRIFPCVNIAPDKKEWFIIDHANRKKAEDYGQVVTMYHSHTNGNNDFSELDKAIAEKLNISSVLFANGNFKEYFPCGYEVPYTGRPYIAGIFDCFGLVQDYYKRELNIHIETMNHPLRYIQDWHATQEILIHNKRNNNFLKDFFIRNGFVEVKDRKPTDLLIGRLHGIKCACHCAIYLGDNKVLHQADFGGVSKYEYLDNKFEPLILHTLRHQTLI